jgi:hypothetical protein
MIESRIDLEDGIEIDPDDVGPKIVGSDEIGSAKGPTVVPDDNGQLEQRLVPVDKQTSPAATKSSVDMCSALGFGSEGKTEKVCYRIDAASDANGLHRNLDSIQAMTGRYKEAINQITNIPSTLDVNTVNVINQGNDCRHFTCESEPAEIKDVKLHDLLLVSQISVLDIRSANYTNTISCSVFHGASRFERDAYLFTKYSMNVCKLSKCFIDGCTCKIRSSHWYRCLSYYNFDFRQVFSAGGMYCSIDDMIYSNPRFLYDCDSIKIDQCIFINNMMPMPSMFSLIVLMNANRAIVVYDMTDSSHEEIDEQFSPACAPLQSFTATNATAIDSNLHKFIKVCAQIGDKFRHESNKHMNDARAEQMCCTKMCTDLKLKFTAVFHTDAKFPRQLRLRQTASKISQLGLAIVIHV